jgi:hypothetical protein
MRTPQKTVAELLAPVRKAYGLKNNGRVWDITHDLSRRIETEVKAAYP